ncbi:hypothetical protein DFH07DRAFT_976437 [Mycena maculata]|uniref:VWFA domain-containing protein n=1 Tax=Mycena maculata TaxID=230809 RepID=A0AAD7K3G8_9AGAR|nr:hypothetical protein DFH07DRAFT_976437 [Mycena maculata]
MELLPSQRPLPYSSTAFISSSSKTPFLNIAMNVEPSPHLQDWPPSHTVSTETSPSPTSLASLSALDKNFVLTVKSTDLDTPHCVAELHPTHDTAAMGLTLVPRFKLPELSRQELVFLVDRLGSTGGQRIEAAKKALAVMLRALPHQESLFQIASFGTDTSFLWSSGSKPYDDQHTLEDAMRRVDGMRADWGHGDPLDRPTSLLVLTDGDAWDLDGVLGEVKSGAPASAFYGFLFSASGTPLRRRCVKASFVQGTGRGTDAAHLEYFCRLGPNEKEEAAATLDEDDFEVVETANEKILNIFNEDFDDPIQINSAPHPPPPVVLPPPPAAQQAPFKIQNLLPNIRLNIHAILHGKTIPEGVIIRGSTAEGAEIELPVAVALSHLQNSHPPSTRSRPARSSRTSRTGSMHSRTRRHRPAGTHGQGERRPLGKTYSISSSPSTRVPTGWEVHSVPVSAQESVPPAFMLASVDVADVHSIQARADSPTFSHPSAPPPRAGGSGMPMALAGMSMKRLRPSTAFGSAAPAAPALAGGSASWSPPRRRGRPLKTSNSVVPTLPAPAAPAAPAPTDSVSGLDV